jgi:membrane protein implicated in regulation of membrane protease activity
VGVNLLNFFLGALFVIALILLIFGLKRKSRLSIFFGVIAIITALLYIIFDHWIILLLVVPAISFKITEIVREKIKSP